MPLKFVLGPSGSGKTYQLYKNVIAESKAHPEENFIVLVPEQFTMQTQKDLVTMHDRHAIMNIDVLSFVRLAYRIFEETGAGTLPVLDDEGKNLILRKIAGNHENELRMLRGNIRKLGYISEVKSVLSEFAQYDIGEEEIDRVMENAGRESRLYYKLADMKVLYRGFQDYLKERYISKEELLDVLSRVVCKSEILKNSTIVLDGFTGFTPVQNRLLGELMKHCRKVMITVTIDPAEDPYRYEHPYQLFALSKHMVTSMIQLAKENQIEIEEPMELFDKIPYRFRDNPALAFLERNLFRYRKETYEGEQDAVKIHVAREPGEEALAAAQQLGPLHHIGDVLPVKGLEDDVVRLHLQRLHRKLRVGRGEDDDDVAPQPPQGLGQMDAVHPRHVDVQQGKIHHMAGGVLNGRVGIGEFPHNFKIRHVRTFQLEELQIQQHVVHQNGFQSRSPLSHVSIVPDGAYGNRTLSGRF